MSSGDGLFLGCTIDVTAELAGLFHKVGIQLALLHRLQMGQVLPSSGSVKNETLASGEEHPDAFARQVVQLNIRGVAWKEDDGDVSYFPESCRGFTLKAFMMK